MKYEITIDDQLRHVDVSRQRDGRFRVEVDGIVQLVDLSRPTSDAFQMLIDDASWEAGAVPTEGGWLVDIMGLTTRVEVVDPRRRALQLSAGAAGGTVSTQMPGRVVRLCVQAGEEVVKGQPLLVVEAMKMENEMKAPVAGRVAEIFVVEGQTVESGARLVRIE
jgi:acetyl/propionyl-CoA carboxylase alpha subunit